MFNRIFLAHPRSVDESYFAHAGVAIGFGTAMIGGGITCLIHAVVPSLCTTTASNTFRRLHWQMATRRRASNEAAGSGACLDFQI